MTCDFGQKAVLGGRPCAAAGRVPSARVAVFGRLSLEQHRGAAEAGGRQGVCAHDGVRATGVALNEHMVCLENEEHLAGAEANELTVGSCGWLKVWALHACRMQRGWAIISLLA